ncbi:signal peptidase I [Geitlerinema sp. PCC 7407]|uniref:signal peptidase I n=1 Tax=Geitlerinema sp. PCC 7407 TaxID=1173025 RepID=UPI00059BF6C0|nr:signal peptidase I [Geitlerinema sp. PCC 7407]
MSQSNPWIAVNLSVCLPGLGHIYAAQYPKAGAWFLGTLGCALLALRCVFAAEGNTAVGLFFAGAAVVVYASCLLDAYYCLSEGAPPAFPRSRDRWFAVFLSQVLPGLGHLYLQRLGLGAVLMVAMIVASNIASQSALWIAVPPTIAAIACCSAYQVNTSPRSRSKTLITAIVILLLVVRLGVASLPLALNAQLERFVVPSGSMQPTLQVGDRMFVRKSAAYRPQLGDLIVFRSPRAARSSAPQSSRNNQSETFFVKRVIGTPGQTIEVQGGQVYLNGQAIDEPYLTEAPRYRLAPVTLGPDQYFVLGDNRNNSYDSHVWGPMNQSVIVGQAYKIYWPLDRSQSLLPEDR